MRSRRLWKNWLSGLGLALTAGVVAAQDVEQAGHRRAATVPCPPVIPCLPLYPPLTPVAPGMPTPPGAPSVPPGTTQPPAPGTPGAPAAPPDAAPPAATAATAAFAEAPSAGTGGTASIAPNMMGDLLGARSFLLQGISRDLIVRFPSPVEVPGGVRVDPVTGLFRFGNRAATAAELGVSGLDPFFQPAARGVPITPERAATAQGVLEALAASPGTPFEPVEGLPDRGQGALRDAQGSLFRELDAASPVRLVRVRVDPVSGMWVTDLEYRTRLTGEFTEVPISIPSPGSGGVVGRVKMSEENNPIPRDRVVFVYDYFSNTALTASGIDVNRFQFGLEKTYLNGRGSVEARLPFAGTLNSTVVAGREDWNTELGNLRLANKFLWWRGPTVFLSSGIGVSLPTSRDVNVFLEDGTHLLRVKNESVQVEPFMAVLLMPTDRLFFQTWGSFNADVSGSPIFVNPRIFEGVNQGVRMWDRSFVAVDCQLGYWVYRSDYDRLSGLAPFVELHWNRAIPATDQVVRIANRNGVAVTDTGGAEELNMTAGITALFSNRLAVTVGGSAPLFSGNRRTFDGQFGVRVNWFFGPTARQMSPALAVSGF
jgi:hypothetical protein